MQVQVLTRPPGLHPEPQRVPLQRLTPHRRRGGGEARRLVGVHELGPQVHHHARLQPAAVDPEPEFVRGEQLRRAPVVVHREVQRESRDHAMPETEPVACGTGILSFTLRSAAIACASRSKLIVKHPR